MIDPLASAYVELEATSHFSFLRGVSSPEELFAAAALLGMPALGIADRNSVAGVVRAYEGMSVTGVRSLAGARVDLRCGSSILVYPTDKPAWSRLTRLLTLGKGRAGKGRCDLGWDDLAAAAEGQVAILLAGDDRDRTVADAERVAHDFGDRGWLALSLRRRPGDALRLADLDAIARRSHLGAVATGDVLYHTPDRRLLQDVVTCIRHGCTIDDAGFRRERYADRHLKSGVEMARRFAALPHAVEASAIIATACRFSLKQLEYQYPDESVDNRENPQATLDWLTWERAGWRYPDGVPANVAEQLRHELALIAELAYAPYFLTVHAIVRYARSQDILCQGRGSAANSAVCYVLGITSIDPVQSGLLFERFISNARDEPPDIDVDFEHERREEVIQWIYATYGRDCAALTATIIRYRAKGAVREVGKVLGLSENVTAALAGQVWGWSREGVETKHAEALNLDTADRRLGLTLDLARQLIGTPRHLSQHPGGFVLTHDRLDDLVPIEPARMALRQVIEWDKDDIALLRFMKVDVLGLGMLGCMRRGLDLLLRHKGERLDLATIPQDDPATYDMICAADTVGVFQIESRAQMTMLPRLRPRKLYDLVIEVAIVRPGPIQGDMVHPYLRRRENKEAVDYPSDELRLVLEKTLGVPLFQEQAMKVAMVAAKFSATEADALRRSMATFKHTGGVGGFHDKMITGMVANGYTADFAERTFRQIEGFGSYGFPESHAASFALLAYTSSWLKCHHPDVFLAAILNAQPMGFYAPAQLVGDARAHDVEVRPVCIAASGWDSDIEDGGGKWRPVRLGLRMAKGLAEADARALITARDKAPFTGIADVWRRGGVRLAALERLADADAFAALGLDRRQALWAIRGLGEGELPLFAGVYTEEPKTELRPLTPGSEVVADYRSVHLSLRAHPLSFVRDALSRRRIIRCGDLGDVRDGRAVEVAGLVLLRQKPGSAKGVMFITIEDESGIANLVVWARLYEAQRRLILSASMISVRGRVQREGEVIHVVAERLRDETALLAGIGDGRFEPQFGPGDAAKHGGGADPRDARPRARDIYAPDRPGVPTPREPPIRQAIRDFR